MISGILEASGDANDGATSRTAARPRSTGVAVPLNGCMAFFDPCRASLNCCTASLDRCTVSLDRRTVKLN
jgi:hypothetical protein